MSPDVIIGRSKVVSSSPRRPLSNPLFWGLGKGFFMKEKIGIIGYGHLGSALDRGFIRAGYETVINNGDLVMTRRKLEPIGIERSRARELSQMAEDCVVLALCIKSHDLETVGNELSNYLDNRHTVFTFLAQTSLLEVVSVLGDKSLIVRVMTTLGVAEQKGVSAYQLLESVDLRQIAIVNGLISEISAPGCVFRLNSEEEIQLFTVAVGCFPGFMAYFLNQLRSRIKQRNEGSLGNYEKVLPVLLGSVSQLLIDAGSLQALQERIATKGGVTSAMIDSLEQSGLGDAIDRSIEAGLKRMQLSIK